MTTLATRGGRQMAAVLATCNLAVVAARAACADTHIGVELRWCPTAVALVAGRAVGCCGHVVGALTGGARSVMAAGAIGGCGEGVVVRLGTAPGGI